MKKKLENLLPQIGRFEINGESSIFLEGVELDSRRVKSNYLFVALKGTHSDGHDHINQAIHGGATAIICESKPLALHPGVTYVVSEDAREDLGIIAANFYDRPSQKLNLIGVTGTNGKTTVATLLYNLFKEMGFKVGLISTIEILINDEKYPSALTTPDIITINRLLAQMYVDGCEYVFMEVSSHAAHQKRIAGLHFRIGIFTNITHDHLDYHKTFKEYIRAKKLFFDHLSKDSIAVINIDDPNGIVMTEHSKARVVKYSLSKIASFRGKVFSEDSYGMYLSFNDKAFHTKLSGRFNAYNLLAIFAVAKELTGIDDTFLLEKLSNVNPAKGRMEIVSREPRVIVDYAHTPDALQKVLSTLRESKGYGMLYCVAGCGGDRDRAKRPLMGKVMVLQSDVAIFTSDNPRSESPSTIIEEMKSGLSDDERKRVLEIADRLSAIKTVLMLAKVQDTILIAGKGHEEYQEIAGVKYYFSDQEIVKDSLSKDI